MVDKSGPNRGSTSTPRLSIATPSALRTGLTPSQAQAARRVPSGAMRAPNGYVARPNRDGGNRRLLLPFCPLRRQALLRLGERTAAAASRPATGNGTARRKRGTNRGRIGRPRFGATNRRRRKAKPTAPPPRRYRAGGRAAAPARRHRPRLRRRDPRRSAPAASALRQTARSPAPRPRASRHNRTPR